MDVLVTVDEYDLPNRGLQSDSPDPRNLPRRVLIRGAGSYESAKAAVELVAGLPVKHARADFIPAKRKGDRNETHVHYDVMHDLSE
jgi:hypothetical protein